MGNVYIKSSSKSPASIQEAPRCLDSLFVTRCNNVNNNHFRSMRCLFGRFDYFLLTTFTCIYAVLSKFDACYKGI